MKLLGDTEDELKDIIMDRGFYTKKDVDEVYVCPDCEAVLYRGYPQCVIDKNIEEELRARERGMIKKSGGNRNSRKRKKPQKSWRRSYSDIDSM